MNQYQFVGSCDGSIVTCIFKGSNMAQASCKFFILFGTDSIILECKEL